ncbi:MAG: F0F1 ATP synthase subunit epsilon [Hyphomicrobiaceae bacterium]
MAGHFKFELVSPERLVLSEDADQVVVPGTEGDFAVLPGHAPLLSTLRPGILEARLAGGKTRRIFVKGGFAEVDPGSLTILAQQVFDADGADREALKAAIAAAEVERDQATSDDERMSAELTIDHLRRMGGASAH